MLWMRAEHSRPYLFFVRHRAVVIRLSMLFAVCIALSACSQVPTSLEEPNFEGKARGGRPVAEDKPLRPTVDWRNCGPRFDCASVRVPVDYKRPGDKKIKLALIRLPAPKKAKRIGSLIVNPGGPGGSGVDFVRHGAVDTVPAEVRARFDVVGFDPRGVGKSAGIDCGEAPQEFLSNNFIPDNGSELDAVLRSAEAVAGACAENNPELLPHMATAYVARDLDAIRRAVGDRQLTYLGFSYGSTIGLTYAEQFPAQVRAMVLDGPVDPAVDGLQRARDQARVLEKTLREFVKVCSSDSACRGYAGKLTMRRFDRLISGLLAAPLPSYSGTRSLRSAEALVATAVLLKDRGMGWPVLAAGIDMAERGDGSLLLSVAESTMSDGTNERQWLAPLLAVNCLDIQPPEPGQYPAAVAELKGKSRHFGALMLLLSSPCAYWEIPTQRQPRIIRAVNAPPAVVIGTTGDPTTPYHWAKAVAANLRGSVLLTRDGAGHTAFGRRNVCTDRTVSRYLVDTVLPAVGTSCG